MTKLSILALEPYGALSHRLFLEGLREHSRHGIELSVLPARLWKWRMSTAAMHYADLVADADVDLLLVSDYVNLAELRALLPRGQRDLPAVIYFHENQLTYPLQEGERRDYQFPLTNLHSILAADAALFNSHYHLESFFGALPELLRHAPDVDLGPMLVRARANSEVLGLGTDLEARQPCEPVSEPVILWNHRWEYDKDPDRFVQALCELAHRGEAFRVRVLGESFRERPVAFEELRAKLGERLEHIGFLPDRAAYLEALDGAHVTVSTARHEFFGLGTLEALRRGLLPVLPNDLAYPELLPDGDHEPFLYERGEGPLRTLARALELVRSGGLAEARARLVRHTDRFCWHELAPRFDAVFERAVSRA